MGLYMKFRVNLLVFVENTTFFLKNEVKRIQREIQFIPC